MLIFTDQLNRTINLPTHPSKIISLVPSQTELLHHLGLEKEVVGITKFCVHPEKWFREKTRIGGTKDYHFDRIEALQPDLIIANKEENDREQVEALAEKYPVWTSDVQKLEDAIAMIKSLGEVVNRREEAIQLATEIQTAFASLKQEKKPKTAVYVVWRKPYMVAGGDTFINEMMQWAGFENLFKNQDRYPQLELADLKRINPEVILLPSEPFPFKEKHLAEFQEICPAAQVQLVDGELYSWYGNRLLEAARVFAKKLT